MVAALSTEAEAEALADERTPPTHQPMALLEAGPARLAFRVRASVELLELGRTRQEPTHRQRPATERTAPSGSAAKEAEAEAPRRIMEPVAASSVVPVATVDEAEAEAEAEALSLALPQLEAPAEPGVLVVKLPVTSEHMREVIQ